MEVFEMFEALVSCPRNTRYFVAIKMGRRPGKRVGGSAYWRIGVRGSKTAFRRGYNNQEVSTELMMLCKRRHADTPTRRHADTSIRRYVSPSRPIFIATLWAGVSWLFFRVARSTRMTQIWALRSRLEKQPTDLRQNTSYFGDRTLGCVHDQFLIVCGGQAIYPWRCQFSGSSISECWRRTVLCLKSQRIPYLGY